MGSYPFTSAYLYFHIPGSVEACAFVPAKPATWVTAAKPIALTAPIEFKRQRIGGDVLVSRRRDDSDDSSSSSSSSSSEDEAPPPPKRSPPPAKPVAPARAAVPSKAPAKRDEDLVPPWARAKATATATSPAFTPAAEPTPSVADTTAAATKKRKDSTSSSVLPPPPAPAASFALPGLPAAAKRTPVPMAAPIPLQTAAAAQLLTAPVSAPAPATAEAKTIRCPLATCSMTFATEKAAKQHHSFKHKALLAGAAAPVVHAQGTLKSEREKERKKERESYLHQSLRRLLCVHHLAFDFLVPMLSPRTGAIMSPPVVPPLAPPAPAMQFASLSAAMSRFNAPPSATPLGFPAPSSVAKTYPLPVFPAPKPMAAATTAFAPLTGAWPNTHVSGTSTLAESDEDNSSDADDEADVVPYHAAQATPTVGYGGVARVAAGTHTGAGAHIMQESDEDDDDIDDEDELADVAGYAPVSLPVAARTAPATVAPAAISTASSDIASGNARSLAATLPDEFQAPFMSQVESLQQQFQQQFDQQITALSTYYQQLAAKTPTAKKIKTPTPVAVPLAAPVTSPPAVPVPMPMPVPVPAATAVPSASVARLVPFAPLPMSSTLPFAPLSASTATVTSTPAPTVKPFTPLPLPSGFTPASVVPPSAFGHSIPAQSTLLAPTPASTPDASMAADCLRLDLGKSQLKLTQSLAAPLALIDKPQQIAAAVRDLAKRNVMSVDCEGINMDRRGKLCLVSIATSQKRYLFDIVTLGATVFDQGLRAILENPQIVKLFFDSRRDSDALFHQFQVRLQCVLDCQARPLGYLIVVVVVGVGFGVGVGVGFFACVCLFDQLLSHFTF
jgi:hypothetical protein